MEGGGRRREEVSSSEAGSTRTSARGVRAGLRGRRERVHCTYLWRTLTLPTRRACWSRFLVFILGAAALSPSLAQQALPPSKLDFSQFTHSSINVSWVATRSGPGAAASFDLRWRPVGAAAWMAGRELTAADVSFVVTGLTASTQYEFSIQSRNDKGEFSRPFTGFGETLSDDRATNVRAVVIKEKEVALAWEPARSSDLLVQQVYVSADGGDTWKYNAVANQGPMLLSLAASHKVTFLMPMATYLFRVVSIFFGYQGAAPSVSSQIVVTLPASPQTVIGLRINNLQPTSATLSWEPLVGTGQMGALSVIYFVDMAEVGMESQSRDSYVVRDTFSLDVSSLLRHVEYFFTVVAQNNEGKRSLPSEAGVFTTPGALAAQMDPPLVTKTEQGLLLSWNPLVTNVATGGLPIESFVLYTKRQDEVGFDSGQNVGNVISYEVLGLTPNFFYEFSVSAVNSVGTGPRGKASFRAMPPIPPAMQPPTVHVFDDGERSVIEVGWIAPALAENVLNYRVFLRQMLPFTAMDNGSVVPASQRTYRFYNLPDGTRFQIKVAAQTSSGLTNISSGVYAETHSDTIPTSVVPSMRSTGSTSCQINVSWTKPRLPVAEFRVFATIASITGADTFLSGTTRPYYVVPSCVSGASYVYYVQALDADGSGGLISLDSPILSVPVSPPSRMEGPTLSLHPDTPATGILVSWIPPLVINPVPKSVVTSYILTIRHPQASNPDDVVKVVSIQAPSTTYTLTGLLKKTYYTFMVQAVNSLGPSQENPTSSITTAQTAPAAVVNLTVVAGSESSQGDSLTLTWAVSDWGESDKANAATPSGYPYCPVSWLVQTTCPGYRYFLVTPFRIGDDYRKPTFVYGNAFRYTLSGLSGGVDYTFVVTAVNTGGLESPKGDARMNSGTGVGVLKYRTVSVVPRQITSLNVYTPPNPDLGANYRIGIEWTIPIDTETTGGMTLAGFVLEYGLLAGCQDGCADSSTACIASRSGILWTVVANVGYVDRFEWTAGLKGMTYVFRISAVNGIGRGATWPSCATVSDINCAGVPNGQIPYTCHSAVFTVPSKAKDFGIWGDTAAGAQPIAGGGFEVRWGLGAGNAANEYFSYSDKTLNGGRNIEMVEIQRTKRTTLRWPLDYYCPTLPANQEGELPVCVYATGCVPVPCTAACPICVTSAYTQSALEIKKITDFIIGETLDFADIYLYRIRFSNVGINDCASRPVLTSGSSPNCDWSEWSELAQVQVAKPNRYHNLFTRVNSPTEVQILWFVPTGVLANGASPADFGDFVNIWFGPTVASVSVSPFDKGNFTKGPARGTSWQTFPVTKLVPATTYFFTVVSYYSTNNNEIQSTRSDVTRAVRTSVAIPASVANCSVTVPAVAADVMAGGLVVSWIQLAPTCTKGNGLFLADGSVHNCERGEGIPLASYKISYRKFEGGGWNSIRVSSSLDTYTVRGLEKETKYLFKVSAINSAHEGSASPEATGTPIATIPGSPPPPLSTGASVSSVRVAWQEPADLGTKQILETKFRLTIYPRRDGRPGNETITFTWEREYVVTGLIPNSLYLFSVAYQAKPMLGFGFKSETAFVFTTPLAPVNLRLNDGKSVTESTTVRIKWSWTGVIQGNVTITGYRLSFASSDGTSQGQTFCAGGSPPVDGIPGGHTVTECVLAGLVNGKLYTITSSASNDPRLETNFGPDSEAMLLQTKPALPTVVNIQFTDTSAYATKIMWTTYDGGLPIVGYALRASREGAQYDADQNMMGVDSWPGEGGIRSSYVVTGLGANLFYNFVVVARNTLGFGPSEASEAVLTLPPAPSIPTIMLVSSNYAKVTWQVWFGKNLINDYRLEARVNMDAGNIGPWFAAGSVTGHQAQVSSLLANTGYDIRVAAVNNAGNGEYGEILHIKMQAAPPDLVYVTNIGPGIVDLRWLPKPGATPGYTVIPSRWIPASSAWVSEYGRSKTEGKIDSFHVTGLVKGAEYRFEVATSSPLGVGALSAASHQITTASDLPEAGPKPTLSNPSVAGLVVSWPALVTNDGNGGSQVIAYVLESLAHVYGSGGWQVTATLVAAPDTGMIPTTYVAGGLQPDVNYQFRVAIVNRNGQGPAGPESDPMPTVPGALPPPFQQAFLKTILLTWTPPENNSFTAYRIGFSQYANDPNGIAQDLEALWTPWTFQIVPSSTTLMKYDSLFPDYPYRLKMAARNPSGWGADSPIVESRTTIVADAWAMSGGNVALLISTTTITTTAAQLTWTGPASTEPSLRGSAVGFRVTACQASSLICDTGDQDFIYCQEDPPNIYTRSHECDRTKSSYIRGGLLKNTWYYFELSVVNSGGEGPRSKPSPQFRTKADYPVQMARPVATSLSQRSISVSWTKMVDWNDRGGLDITGYALFKQAEGYSYDAGEVVYEGTSYTYSDLPSNTKFYFAIVAENTWCTLCRTDITVPEGGCFFEACCDVHSCSPKSPNTIPVSTLPGKMTPPRLVVATIYDILVTWDVVPGTPNNIFEYEIRFRDIDRADKDDSGGWVQRIFLGSNVGIGVKVYALVNLEPNNRYEVILNANNGEGYGEPSAPAILMTLPNQIQGVEVVAVRSTEITLEWQAPPGRLNNILGYNISYRVATHTEVILQRQSETLPLSYVTSGGTVTRFDVINLQPNASYIFSVAAINGGGVGEFSVFTPPKKTMVLDLLGACYFYPVEDSGNGVMGNFILQQKSSGTATLSGNILGLEPTASYSLVSWQYGRSSTRDYGSIETVTTFTASLNGNHALVALPTALVLIGPKSAISSTLSLLRVSDGMRLSQCEMGIAKPRSGADENAALPPVQSRAFCKLVPMSGAKLSGVKAPKLSGGFIASPTASGIRVRGRVCGIQDVAPRFSVRLHEFGDIQKGNYDDIGPSVNDMGTMYVDNLDSCNFDLIDATGIGFSQTSDLINMMGRSIVLYNQTYPSTSNPNPAVTALAACVIGAYEPNIDTTVYQVQALPPVCTLCTWLMGLQESMYTVAELFHTDWISVWSLNKANNPDRDVAGSSVYYAHPYVMQEGETISSVRHRFGVTLQHLALLNNKRTEFVAGETMCIVPMWTKAINKNGALVCHAHDAPGPHLNSSHESSKSSKDPVLLPHLVP